MITRFEKDEQGYEYWVREFNGIGYVFNYCKTPTLNIFHHANCPTLRLKKNAGVRTNYEKLCSTNEIELETEVIKLCGSGWSKCKRCF